MAAVPLCACAAVLGIDDGHPRAAGDDGGSSTVVLPDGAVVVVEAGGADAGDADGGDSSVMTPTTLPDGAPIPPGCEDVALDVSTGVFVASTGAASDATGCGTPAAPCLTVQNAINLAHDNAATPNVYVADGTYLESLALKSGVNVIGGWTISASGAWARDCDETHTTIATPNGVSVAVSASDLPEGSGAKLSTLSIVAGHPGAAVDPNLQAGESLFGVIATGANTVITLVRVSVATGPAANGALGAAGAVGATPSGECPPGDGGPGTTPGSKGLPAEAGTFSASGYAAGAAGEGTSGSSGAAGVAGGDAGCVACLLNCSGVGCTGSATAPNCGSPGQAGCGGGGGQGGLAGETAGAASRFSPLTPASSLEAAS